MAGRLWATLLNGLALAGVMAGQPQGNPRGWQAARRAEQRAAVATQVPPTIAVTPQPRPLPFVSDLQQQSCSFENLPACPEPLHTTAWAQLAVVAAIAFLAGMAAGILLLQSRLRRLHRQQRRHRQLAADSQASLLSEAASCAPAVGAGGQKQQEQPHKTATAATLEPAGSQQAEAAAPAAIEDRQAGKPATPAAGAIERIGSCQMVEESSGESSPSEATGEAAVAAAVQKIVLQQSSGSGVNSAAAHAAAADTPTGVDAAAAAVEEPAESVAIPELQLPTPPQVPLQGLQTSQQAQQVEQEQEKQESQQAQQAEQEQEPKSQQQAPGAHQLAAMAGPSLGGDTSAADHDTIGVLRADDQADIQAAAQLVLTMCRSMHVDPAQLDRGERLQLIYTMLHAWQAQQARRHTHEVSRLGSEANVLRGEQRDIAAQQAAQQAAKDAYRLSLERTAEFRRMCSDTLTFGLVVMVVAGTYQLLSRGLLLSITSHCGSITAAAGGRRWGLWATWRAGEALMCHLLSVGDALLGLVALLAAPWLVYRSGLLSDYHTMPLTKLFVGLGLVCGLAGYLAVGKLGGKRGAWLAAWEAWVALHIAFSAAAHRTQRIKLRSAQAGGAGTVAIAGGGEGGGGVVPAAMYEQGGGWLASVMWLLLGLVLPLLAGTLPFRM